jgi:hypothetical protein
MKKPAQHRIVEVPRRQAKGEITIGIDLGDVWSHYCTLNQNGEVVDRGRFRTTPKAIEKWFTDLPSARVAMEAGTHSIWISEQLQKLGTKSSWRTSVSCARSRKVIGGAIRSMLRSWHDMPCLIRTSCGRSRTATSSSKRRLPWFVRELCW